MSDMSKRNTSRLTGSGVTNKSGSMAKTGAPAQGVQRKLRIIVGLAVATLLVGGLLFFKDGFQGDRIEKSKNLVDSVGLGLGQYFKVCGAYPSSEQGLKSLKEKPTEECPDWRGPYTTEEFVDGWGTPLFYSSDKKMFDLRSFGKDGKIGGGNSDADLVYSLTPIN